MHKKIAHISQEYACKHKSFPAFNGVFGVREHPQKHHRHNENSKIEHSDAVDFHWRDDTC